MSKFEIKIESKNGSARRVFINGVEVPVQSIKLEVEAGEINKVFIVGIPTKVELIKE